MFNLIYVTWDEVNQSYTEDWATLNGVPLTAERVRHFLRRRWFGGGAG